MDPSSNERTGLDLPAPVKHELAPAGSAGEVQNQAPESAQFTSENGPAEAASNQPALQAIPLPPAPQMPSGSPQSDVTTTTQTVVPIAADDKDLIEKEWVVKAKQIVERTREDPHQQSEQITVFKADYLKKRYNKSIKLSE